MEPTRENIDREWSQAELRDYLLAHGWKPEDFEDGEPIPQGVKFISFEPLTAAEIAWAKRLISEHPEWEKIGQSK